MSKHKTMFLKDRSICSKAHMRSVSVQDELDAFREELAVSRMPTMRPVLSRVNAVACYSHGRFAVYANNASRDLQQKVVEVFIRVNGVIRRAPNDLKVYNLISSNR